MSWSKSHAHSAKFRVNDCIILSKWFMSLQRHYIQSQRFRQHLFSITHPLLFPFYFSRLVLKLFIWQQGSCRVVFEMSDHQDTHWRCWQVTRPSPRSSTSPRGRGAPSPSWPGRWPGWPGDSRPWVLITHWDIGLGHITCTRTCQKSLTARATEDSPPWLERNSGRMPAPAHRRPGCLDNDRVPWWDPGGLLMSPEPGNRQFRTRQTAADLWLRMGIAPLIMLLVILNNKTVKNWRLNSWNILVVD